MNQIVQKNFLSSLLNSTQQNLSATSFAFDLARSAGLTFKTNGNFENGTQLTGTNQDDTVIIGGNLIGGKNEATSIDLMGGNDTVTVGGNVIAHDLQSISLTGSSGSKTIHINGGIDADDATINVILDDYNSVSDINLINIDQIIKASNQAYIFFSLIGNENTTNINNDIYLYNGSLLEIYGEAKQNIVNIKGNVYIDSSDLEIESYSFDDTSKSANAEINIGGELFVVNKSTLNFELDSNNTYIRCKDITATNESSVTFRTSHDYALVSDLIIDGNLTVTNDSDFNLTTFDKADVEISGAIIVQNGVINMDMEGGNITILGGISNTNSDVSITLYGENETNIYIEGDIIADYQISPDRYAATNSFIFDRGDVTFTLIGNLTANNESLNNIDTANGADTITIIGDVSTSNGGVNSIDAYYGDDIINLNGHIAVGALVIDMGDGNDTLVLTANTQKLFETDYKDWLTDLSTSGSLAKSGIETIRVDVNYIQQSKLGWLTDIVNKANADGAHIAVEDKAGHQLVNPSAYLAQNNDAHNPINNVLDHYAPAAANATQPKALAENVAASSSDAFAAPHFDNNNFLHEMEQQAQVHATAAA